MVCIRILGAAYVEAAAELGSALTLDPRAPPDPRFSPDHAQRDEQAATRAPRTTTAVSPRALFDAYAAQVRLAPATEKAWRRYVQAFTDYLGHADARKVRPEDVVGWKDHLLEEVGAAGRRSGRTVRDGYVAALDAVLGWARENHRLTIDPTHGVRVRVSKRIRRPDQASPIRRLRPFSGPHLPTTEMRSRDNTRLPAVASRGSAPIPVRA